MTQGTEITLPILMGSALVDSLNPCAFALLMVFVATMLAMLQQHSNKATATIAQGWLLSRGGVYILGIFLTYLALGFGLLSVLELAKGLSSTHLVGRLAALFAMGLGVVALQELMLPELGVRLSAHISMPRLRNWLTKLSLPALFGAGVLVGLCTVPCSGAVYLAVLALLTSQTTLLQGVIYLILYNLVFVAPLVVILVLASRPAIYRRLARWQLHRRAYLKLGTSLMAITVGVITLIVV